MTRLPVVGQPLMDGRGVLVPGIDDRGNLDRRQRLLMRLYENSDVAAGVFLRVTTGGQNEVNLDWTLPPETLATCASIEVYRLDPGLVAVDPGAVFSIAYGNHSGTAENHYHANAAGTAPGLPLSSMEVGGLLPLAGDTEICRGLCEFKVTSYPAGDVSEARLRFKVQDVTPDSGVPIGGLHGQTTPYAGPIDIEAYAADNVDSPADFDAPTLATLASAINTTGAIVDQEYDVDVTALYQAARAQSDSVGFRLKTPTEPIDDNTAITFYDSKLDVTADVPNLVHTETDCNATSWQDTLLTEGQEYCYFIVVKDSGDNTIDTSSTDCAYAGLIPIITPPIPDRTDDVGDVIDVTFTATGTAPITWSAENLPPSLSIDADGRVTGTLTAVGDYTVHVRATNVIGLDHTTFVWSVVRLAPIVDNPGPQTNQQYDAADLSMTLSQGTEPVTWTAVDLPPGASINANNGHIFGTLTTAGVYSPRVTATNTAGTSDVLFSWTVTEVIAPVLDNPGLQSSTQGDLINLPIGYSQGTPPFEWEAEFLPTGLSIDSATGVISGTVTHAGEWDPVVRARNAAGIDQITFHWSVSELLVPPILNNPPTQSDDQDAAVSLDMTIYLVQGSQPITWSAVNLPPGLSINATSGLITGTCPEDAVYNPTVRATNALTFSDANFQWTINTIPPDVVQPAPQSDEIGSSASLAMQLEGGSEPTLWEISGQPPGLSINSSTGVISGIPSAVGDYPTTVTASNTAGPDSVVFDWNIFSLIPIIDPISNKSNLENQQITPFTPTISQGSPVIVWSAATANPLPPGISINPSTGEISGITTTVGEYDCVIEATNDAGTGTQSFQWSVGAVAPIVTAPANQSSTYGDVISGVFATATGTAPIAFSVEATHPLPGGLSINSATGEITGTITESGTFNPIVRATNVAGSSTDQFQWTVAAIPLAVDNPGPQSDPDDTPITPLQMTYSQGSPPVTWESLNLPTGLSIDPNTGIISGTTIDWGTYTATVIATNPFGPDSVNFDWEITQVTPVVAQPQNQTNAEGDSVDLTIDLQSGSTPVTWSVDPSFPLPAGLSINSATGQITGICTGFGNYTPRVIATNGATPPTGHVDFLWDVSGTAPSINDPGAQSGVVTDVISLAVTASGSAGITWSIDPLMPLPPTLALTDDTGPSCEITGTLTALFDDTVRLIATNPIGTDTVDIPWTVTGAPEVPVINPIADQSSPEFSVINLALSTSQGTLPITWEEDPANPLPPGLTLAATGDTSTAIISGTVTGYDTYNCRVSATNVHGTDTEEFEWIVTPILVVIDQPLDQENDIGDSVVLEITWSEGSTPITWSEDPANPLPDGLSIDPVSGVITGQPTTQDISSVTIRADNPAGQSTTTFTWTVTAVLVAIDNPGNQVNTTADDVVLQMTYSAGSEPITWSEDPTNSLPPGLTIASSTGLITGIPTTEGSYSVTIRADNAAGQSTTAFSWEVTGEPVFNWDDYPNLYYRGDGAVVSESGGLVDIWPDQTANNHNLTPSTVSYKPTYVPSLINSLPGISFTGLITNLRIPSWTAISQPNSMMGVIRINTNTSTRFFVDSDVTTARNSFYQPSPTFARMFAGVERTMDGTIPNDQWFIVAMTFFGDASKFYVNGGINKADVGSPGDQQMGALILGTRFGGTQNPADMDLAEFIVNDGGFTSTEFNEIGTYWADKYALSWTEIVDVATAFALPTEDHLQAETPAARAVVFTTGGATISCWVKKSVASTQRECVFAVGNSADSLEIHIDATGHPIVVHQVGGLKAEAVSVHAIDDGTWHLLTARFESQTSRSIQVDTNAPQSDSVDVQTLPAVTVVAISRNAEGLLYEGIIDECMYFDSVLTTFDTQAMYNGKMMATDIVAGTVSLPSGAKPDHAWNLSSNNFLGRGEDVGTMASQIPCHLDEEGSPSATEGINAL